MSIFNLLLRNKLVGLILVSLVAACGGGSTDPEEPPPPPPPPVNKLSFLPFVGTNGTDGFELWKSNGTVAGTKMIKDINSSPGGNSNPVIHQQWPEINHLVTYNNKLVFKADDGAGMQLWITDGKDAGTAKLTSGSYAYKEFTVYNKLIYFNAYNNSDGKWELWTSDGTPEGTKLVKKFTWGVTSFTTYKDKLYFSADDGSEIGEELWVINGAPETVTLFKDLRPTPDLNSLPGNFTIYNGKLYFVAVSENGNYELWVSDGTAVNTQPVKPDTFNFNNISQTFSVFNGKLYFVANHNDPATTRRLYVTDGTAAETKPFYNTNPPEGIQYLVHLNDKLAFFTLSGQMFITDGSADNQTLLSESFYSMDPSAGTAEYNGKLYFSADGVDGSVEPWVSDGTPTGTKMFLDINTTGLGEGGPSSYPYAFREFNKMLYFVADDDVNGNELWVSDGTPEGTNMFINLDGSTGPGVALTY